MNYDDMTLEELERLEMKTKRSIGQLHNEQMMIKILV